MIYVLAKTDGGGEVYFKGGRRHGGVECVAFWSDAARFHDPTAALECANTHPELRNSAEWRVVPITERCERTR